MQEVTTAYMDRILIDLMAKPDGTVIDLKPDHKAYPFFVHAVKRIMDGQYDFIQGMDLSFNDNYTKLKVTKLTAKNHYQPPVVEQDLFS